MLDSNRFVKGARIVEYGPVRANAVWGKSHKGKVLGFPIRFVKGARIVEYGPVPTKAVRGKNHKGKVLDFQ